MHLLSIAANPSIDRLVEVDRFELGEIHRPVRVRVVAGGKGLNVARFALASGSKVSVVMIAGGHSGRWINSELERLGIEAEVVWVPMETRSCLSIASRAAPGALTEVYETGSPITLTTWEEFVQAVDDAIGRRPSIASASGSLPPGAPADGYAQICRLAELQQVRLMLDTGGEPLAAALDAHPWMIKVNAVEAASVVGVEPPANRNEARDLAQQLVRRGASNVVVTLGTEGASCIVDGEPFDLPAPHTLGPYPVGSGDAFLAGMAVSLLRGETWQTSLHHGAQLAATNATAFTTLGWATAESPY